MAKKKKKKRKAMTTTTTLDVKAKRFRLQYSVQDGSTAHDLPMLLSLLDFKM
jgi:hypothetical protein